MRTFIWDLGNPSIEHDVEDSATPVVRMRLSPDKRVSCACCGREIAIREAYQSRSVRIGYEFSALGQVDYGADEPALICKLCAEWEGQDVSDDAEAERLRALESNYGKLLAGLRELTKCVRELVRVLMASGADE